MKKKRKLNHYFISLNQPIKNKMPINKAGKPISKNEIIYWYSNPILNIVIKFNTIYNNPAKINVIAPTNSYFQEIIKIIIKIIEGIFINKIIKIIEKNLNPIKCEAKSINGNKTIYEINKIDNILGIQKINLFTFFCILLI